jgi:hypothetical protein
MIIFKGRFNVLIWLKPQEKDVETPYICFVYSNHAVNDVAILNLFFRADAEKARLAGKFGATFRVCLKAKG